MTWWCIACGWWISLYLWPETGCPTACRQCGRVDALRTINPQTTASAV